jgi:membrane-bound lytic murein transglycosylase F
MTESRLDPDARSWVGARGIMQLMPTTSREIQSKNPEWSTVDDVEWNIAAGIFHDRGLWRLWNGAVGEGDQPRFMFASYNAGRIPLLTAQRMAREQQLDPRIWASVERVAPGVPRWRHQETVTYVTRIFEILLRLDPRGRVVR